MIAMQMDQPLQFAEPVLPFGFRNRFDFSPLLFDQLFVLQKGLAILRVGIAVASCERKIVKKPNTIGIFSQRAIQVRHLFYKGVPSSAKYRVIAGGL
jgi:hypothetical protein